MRQDYADKIKAEVEGDDIGQDSWMVSLTQWTWVLGNSKIVKDREALHTTVHGVTKSQTRLSDWIMIILIIHD